MNPILEFWKLIRNDIPKDKELDYRKMLDFAIWIEEEGLTEYPLVPGAIFEFIPEEEKKKEGKP
jgi:hypothetical protein